MNQHSLQSGGRWANIAFWLSWPALLGSLLAILAGYGNGIFNRKITHNSDAAFIPAFYRDVLARGTTQGWDLPTNPYFFPDMLLFIPLDMAVGNTNLSMILYGVLQLLLIDTGMVLVQRHLFGAKHLAQAIMLLTLALCNLFIATGKHTFQLYMLMSVHHVGVLVVIPFATVSLLRLLQPERPATEQRRAAILLFALTALTALSDSLFIIQFVLPAILALMLWGKREQAPWRRIFLIGTGLLLTAAAGQLSRQLFVPVDKLMLYTRRGNWEAISLAFTNVVHQFREIVENSPLLAFFWLLSVLALVAVVLMSAGRRMQPRHGETDSRALVSGLFLLSMLISAMSAVVSGNEFSSRYILPTLYLPLLAGIPFFLAGLFLPVESPSTSSLRADAATWRGSVWGAVAGIIAVFMLGYVLLTGRVSAVASLATYRDPFVACLERETARRQLRYGLANYWQSISANALSEGRLHLVTANPDLSPYLWNNNRYDYQAPFEFVVIQQDPEPQWIMPEETPLQKFGPPAETFVCESSKIFVYNRPSDLQIRRWFANRPELAELAQVGDRTQFFGYALPSAIGGVVTGLSQGVSEQWGNGDGALVYTPLPTLPAGSYALALDIYAGSANTGAWEVVARPPQSDQDSAATLLASGGIESAGKNTIDGQFTLQQPADVEIRVQYAGHGTLFVDAIRVERIDPAHAAPTAFVVPPAPPLEAEEQPALHLLHPYAGSFVERGSVDFAWQWTGDPLPPHQTFEVRLWQEDENIHYGAHDAKMGAELIRRTGDTYIVRLDLNGAYSVMQHGTGDYRWTVAVVAIEPEYQDLQIEAAPYALSILP